MCSKVHSVVFFWRRSRFCEDWFVVGGFSSRFVFRSQSCHLTANLKKKKQSNASFTLTLTFEARIHGQVPAKKSCQCLQSKNRTWATQDRCTSGQYLNSNNFRQRYNKVIKLLLASKMWFFNGSNNSDYPRWCSLHEQRPQPPSVISENRLAAMSVEKRLEINFKYESWSEPHFNI